jgi:hypothetical protein
MDKVKGTVKKGLEKMGKTDMQRGFSRFCRL